MSGFGERLRKLRGAESKKAFAHRLGVSPQNYQWYEAGRVPNVERLKSIAGVLGVSVDFLLGHGSSGAGPTDRAEASTSAYEVPPSTPHTLREDGSAYGEPSPAEMFRRLSIECAALGERVGNIERLLIALLAQRNGKSDQPET